MRVHTPPSDSVTARFGEPCLSEPGEERTDHQNRTAQGCALLHEIFAFNVFSVNVIRLEAVFAMSQAFYLDSHAFQQAYQVLYIQDFRDIAYDDFFFCEKYRAYYLKSLVLRPLRDDFSVEFMSSLYYKCAVVHFL